MVRLNQQAYEILRDAIQKLSGDDPVTKVQREIALRRLERVREQPGKPMTNAEIRHLLEDLFPNLEDRTYNAASRANQGTQPLEMVKLGMGLLLGTAGLAGVIWLLNLPYPMIRWPVARTIPIILLPSFISMDQNYRQAIALTEQADQLVNQATAPPDLDLGTTKVKEAQKRLDDLPVWFLGYYPRMYCSWFQCGWAFTLDEFRAAREKVGRMDARLFQEKNAQTQLTQGDNALNAAKQAYQQTQDGPERTKIVANWQQAIDTLRQVPPQTLAGRMAQTKLAAYERDFQQVSRLVAGSNRAGSIVGAAQAFAANGEQLAQNPPHSATEWQEIITQWDQAISRLDKIEVGAPDYQEAQTLMAKYQKQRSQVRVKLQQELEAVKNFDAVEERITALLNSVPAGAKTIERKQLAGKLEPIIQKLEKIQPGTTVYDKAQAYLKSARDRLN